MSYKTIQTTSTLDAPRTGLFSGAVLQSNSIPFYGTYWRWRVIPSVGGAATLKLPSFIYDYLMKNGAGSAQAMARRLFIFKDGVKMITNVFTIDATSKDATITTSGGESYITFFASAGSFTDSTYIEVLCLDETVFNGQSHYQKTKLTAGTSGTFVLNFNPSAYVSMKDFYRNVLVFRNGLFMSPGRTYFWWEPDLLNFATPLVTNDTIELYFLNKDVTKPNRIYGQWPATDNDVTLEMPEFPNTQFTPLP